MSAWSMPAYYMIMVGGSLTIVTSIVILFGGLNSYYERFLPIFANINPLTAFALTLLPGLAVLYLGQRFLRYPETQLQTGLAIAGVSIVSLFGTVGSGAVLFVGVLFSGPPIGFTGGILGAFVDRGRGYAPTQLNSPA